MTDEKEHSKEKKIIIDEDWKAQVQSEKAQADAAEPASEQRHRQPLPPANIAILFGMLATQALIALGLVPNPVSKKAETDLDQAKHFIDMLGVLDDKTKGNLSPDERRQLDSLLFDLRLQFVEASSKKDGESARSSDAR